MATWKLKTRLNARIVACGSKNQVVMRDYGKVVSNEDDGDLDVEELIMIYQPTNFKKMMDTKIKEVILE